MKLSLCVLGLLSAMTLDAFGQTGAGGQKAGSREVVEACMTKCSSDDSTCRRTCPITFSGPCLSSCDNRSQSCRQGCQR